MNLTRTIKVSEQEFYDYLENDLIATYNQCTGKTITGADIKKGLNYSKNDNHTHARIDITIQDYRRGEHYQAKLKSMADTITISYRTRPVDNHLEIDFSQRIASFENERHNKAMKMFSEAVYFGRMSDTLFDIQKKIINRREGIVETPTQPTFKDNKLFKKLANR